MDIWLGMSLLRVFRFISRQVDYGGLLLGKTLLKTNVNNYLHFNEITIHSLYLF